MNELRDKVVLVTGGSMGIGKELAIQALRNGAKVAVTGRNESRLKNFRDSLPEYSGMILTHCGNVASFSDDKKLVGEIANNFGRLDVVICNAGISAFGDLGHTSPEVIDEVIDTNIKGSLFIYNAVLPELKKTKGSILFVSSIAGLRGLPSYSLYSLSKMSLTALVQSIRTECRSYGVFVGIAYVGFTRNETDKKTFSPDGTLVQVPERSRLISADRSQTASLILSQIRKRKDTRIHSVLGKITGIMVLFFPFAVRFFFERNYKKNLRNTVS